MTQPGSFHRDDFVEVRLLRLPVPVYAKAQEHADDLVREFELIAQGLKEDGAHEVPARLAVLVEELTATYSGLTTDQEMRLAQAVDAGDSEIDEIEFRVPRQASEASRHLAALLDEADEYSRSGRHVLTLATPEELKRFRDWYLGEFTRQVGGGQPIAWPDYVG